MNTVKGLSFRIADLLLVGGWSEAQSMRMAVHLDYGTDTEDYEEVLAILAADTGFCRWVMWREADCVVIQPLIGRSLRFSSVVDALEALEALEPSRRVAQTHIRATRWPSSCSGLT
nr:hypothetical protein [uncultured Rhodopila sp.]